MKSTKSRNTRASFAVGALAAAALLTSRSAAAETAAERAEAANKALVQKVAKPLPGELPKPMASPTLHKSWCTGNGCNRFCSAEPGPRVACQKKGQDNRLKSVNMQAFQQAAAGVEPSDLVDPEPAVRAALAAHPDFPCNDPDLAKCGVTFHAESGYEQKLRAGVIPGLVRAIVIARNWRDKQDKPAGYGLHVGYSHRTLLCQTQLVCNHFGESPPCDGVELSCPGPNIHSDGVAIDVMLTKDGTRVTSAGSAMDCKAAETKVRGNRHLSALHAVLFGAGWWNYCKEPWHFEYTQNPYSGKFRINGY
jgi:hypothetical protein